jgi:hypothetical protein
LSVIRVAKTGFIATSQFSPLLIDIYAITVVAKKDQTKEARSAKIGSDDVNKTANITKVKRQPIPAKLQHDCQTYYPRLDTASLAFVPDLYYTILCNY